MDTATAVGPVTVKKLTALRDRMSELHEAILLFRDWVNKQPPMIYTDEASDKLRNSFLRSCRDAAQEIFDTRLVGNWLQVVARQYGYGGDAEDVWTHQFLSEIYYPFLLEWTNCNHVSFAHATAKLLGRVTKLNRLLALVEADVQYQEEVAEALRAQPTPPAVEPPPPSAPELPPIPVPEPSPPADPPALKVDEVGTTAGSGPIARPWQKRCNGHLLCSPDCGAIWWRGTEFLFTPNQRALFRYMIAEIEKGRTTFTGSELFLSSGSTANSGNVRDVLRSNGQMHDAWGSLLVKIEETSDKYRLDLP